ncbi:hypothetical protein AgCh_036157 [Apium graveolens]
MKGQMEEAIKEADEMRIKEVNEMKETNEMRMIEVDGMKNQMRQMQSQLATVLEFFFTVASQCKQVTTAIRIYAIIRVFLQ